MSDSWKIAPMTLPRIRRNRRSERLSIRSPSSRIWPLTMRAGGSSSPMIAIAVSDLPAPDSPTNPKISP